MYAWGNGQPGCLFDHIEFGYERIEDAIAAAADLHKLTLDDVAILRQDGILYQRDTDTQLHTGLIEVFESDEEGEEV